MNSFSTGVLDIRWGSLRAWKKEYDIYIINPYEEWEPKQQQQP